MAGDLEANFFFHFACLTKKFDMPLSVTCQQKEGEKAATSDFVDKSLVKNVGRV